ncbi:COX15/CtaA family protein [Ruania zhangjianzhongii]|uniref:COX15/CtaA family protein n=1 Tax=Ruania zhangjianzhongii TaxID=2603206 RepID=UPI001F1B32ED|nr:COX15/CtaA family protein [Ruania zhangjianzhongii]
MSALTYSKLTGRVIVANLVAQIVIIATGGAVRLTGSGLGCSSWPNCEPGEFSPQFHTASSIHPYVEWGNRMMGAVVVIVALAVAVLVFFAARRGVRPVPSTRLLWLATVPLLLSLVQAVLGGLTVVLALHPALVGSHFLFSAALVWLSTWLVIEWYRPGRPHPIVPAGLRTTGWVLAAVGAVVVVLGMVVTGAGPHSGDDEVGYRFAVDPVLIARTHAGFVWLFLAVLAVFLVLAFRAADDGAGQVRRLRHRGMALLAVTLAQGAIGYVQYFTGLPELLVGIHMVGAALLLATLAWTVAGMSERATRAELTRADSAVPA